MFQIVSNNQRASCCLSPSPLISIQGCQNWALHGDLLHKILSLLPTFRWNPCLCRSNSHHLMYNIDMFDSFCWFSHRSGPQSLDTYVNTINQDGEIYRFIISQELENTRTMINSWGISGNHKTKKPTEHRTSWYFALEEPQPMAAAAFTARLGGC
jgi:hypothetical protein